jgi:hypothetical protein
MKRNKHYLIALLSPILLASAFGKNPQNPEPRVHVWTLAHERLNVSQWAFLDYVENAPSTRTLELYLLEKKIGEVPLRTDLAEIFATAQVNPEPARLLRRSSRYALFSEREKQWYILHLENDELPRFHLGAANIAFERVLALSSDVVQSSDAALISAIRRLGAEKPIQRRHAMKK